MSPLTLTYQSTPWLWLIPALPLLGFLGCGLMALLGTRSARGPDRGFVGLFAVLMPALSFVATVAAALALADLPAGIARSEALYHAGYDWFQLGPVALGFGLHFDALASLMLLFVTGIGSLIVLYSTGYMAHDRGFARFMSYLNLFLFAMIMLVLGDNLLVTFLGWEGVGLCSYLLIGFWHHDHGNNDAARKAFIVNRVGDLGFLLGVFALLAAVAAVDAPMTLDYVGLGEVARTHAEALQGGLLVTAATLLLFLGCTGKSAQIPLMVWLPDAMAGPTPVSALIHAATMVTAGVFLLARLADVFVLAPVTMDVITWTALATMLWAAITALFQWDIKKVLAYSTVSQLGFMFLAAGLGRFDIALFHVFTHAFFKATLFLGAGSVIHALHHEQDLRRMGGLRTAMPFTFTSMFLAFWAIAGLPLGAGFFSKDLILEYAYLAHPLLFVLALLAAALTAIYMTRLMAYTFAGTARHPAAAHDPDWRMTLPVFLLGLGSAAAGLVWIGVVEVTFFRDYLAPVLERPQEAFAQATAGGHAADAAAGAADHGHAHHPSRTLLLTLMAISVGVAAGAALLAWRRYRSAPDSAGTAPVRGAAAAWTWGFDRVYHAALVAPSMAVARFLDRVVERRVIAPMPRAVAWLTAWLGHSYRGIQSGRLRLSLGVSVCALALILAVVLLDLVIGGVR